MFFSVKISQTPKWDSRDNENNNDFPEFCL